MNAPDLPDDGWVFLVFLLFCSVGMAAVFGSLTCCLMGSATASDSVATSIVCEEPTDVRIAGSLADSCEIPARFGAVARCERIRLELLSKRGFVRNSLLDGWITAHVRPTSHFVREWHLLSFLLSDGGCSRAACLLA